MMYKSDIDVVQLIDEVLSTINVVPEIPSKVIADYLSDLQDRLYMQIFRPLRRISLSVTVQDDMSCITTKDIVPESGEAAVRIDDICMVFWKNERIFHANAEQFFAMSIPVYTCMDDRICLRNIDGNTVTAVYIVRPAPITYQSNVGYSGDICLPVGYTSLIRAGLLAALCRYIGDDDGFKRYSFEYNDLLKDLKTWYFGKKGVDAT